MPRPTRSWSSSRPIRRLTPRKLIALMQRSKTMRLAGPERLRIDEKPPTLEARLARLREVFRALA